MIGGRVQCRGDVRGSSLKSLESIFQVLDPKDWRRMRVDHGLRRFWDAMVRERGAPNDENCGT